MVSEVQSMTTAWLLHSNGNDKNRKKGWRGCGVTCNLILLAGVEIGTTALENCLAVSTYAEPGFIFFNVNVCNRNAVIYVPKTCTRIFAAAVFIISPK